MYYTSYVLGPADTAEYNVNNYEALRQHEVAQVVEREQATRPEQPRKDVRGWFSNLIPAPQRHA